MTQPSAPGWYPDPTDPLKQRQIYWDGASWAPPAPVPPTEQPNNAPAPAQTDKSDKSKKAAVAFGVCILAAIGLVMTMQSVSLMTGTGSLWTGVAVVAVGAAAAFFLGAPKWVRVVAAICLAIALFNVSYMENQLSKKREELSQVFKN